MEVGSVRFGGPPRVLMLTTSYPQRPGDASGPFVHRLAARLVAAGAGDLLAAAEEAGTG